MFPNKDGMMDSNKNEMMSGREALRPEDLLELLPATVGQLSQATGVSERTIESYIGNLRTRGLVRPGKMVEAYWFLTNEGLTFME